MDKKAVFSVVGLILVCASALVAQSPYIYGIHDHEPNPQQYLDRIEAGGATGWVTATVAIGTNPNDTGGDDFSWLSNRGHTVIVRLNNGYCPNGTIPASPAPIRSMNTPTNSASSAPATAMAARDRRP